MSTGKSPTQARALDMLRRGASLVSVQDLLGVPSVTVKKWATAAGIEVTRPTAEQLEAVHERRRAARKHLRDTTLSPTADKVGIGTRRAGTRIAADHRGPRES
jgi:hypothetical protein